MQGRISPDQLFADAASAWLESRNFAGGKTRARFIAKGTAKVYADYLIPLKRHFGALRLDQIHAGTLRAYQELRATGQLAAPYEEVFARVCRYMRVSVIDAEDNPMLTDLIDKRVAKIRHSEVGPNRINQELSLFAQIMRSAGAWTAELEELYEPLQHEENDIPKALTPSEQNHWLEVSASEPRWQAVHLYSVVAFRTTCSNIEMRHLRVGDINLYAKTINVQAEFAKNKYRIRTIKLSPDAFWACERLLERARELGSVLPQHYIFPFRDIATKEFIPDRPMGGTGLKKPWNEVRDATGLKDFSPQDARHTSITRFAECGTPMAVIMAMAGHISPRMTQHYTQISLQAQEWATQAVYNNTMYPAQTLKQPQAVPIRAHGVKKLPEQKFL